MLLLLFAALKDTAQLRQQGIPIKYKSQLTILIYFLGSPRAPLR